MNFKKWVKSIQTAGYNGARYGTYFQLSKLVIYLNILLTDEPSNFQFRNRNYSPKPNNRQEADRIEALHERRENNNQKYDSKLYQDDPPPIVRPPIPGSRRNPKVMNWHRKLTIVVDTESQDGLKILMGGGGCRYFVAVIYPHSTYWNRDNIAAKTWNGDDPPCSLPGSDVPAI